MRTLAIVFCLLFACIATAQSPGDWITLFDGTSTDQWRGYNRDSFPERGWEVRDDLLIVLKSGAGEDGFGGDIITREQFANFELELEFMLTDTANSGILYMVREFEDTPIWHNAPEFQLLDDERYFEMLGDWMDLHRTGDLYDLYEADHDLEIAVGEWHSARIAKDGSIVQHWLNGELVLQYDMGAMDWARRLKNSKFGEYPQFARARRGHIGLQDHGYEVRFRDIRIRRL